jgi:hypothetical protein
MHVDPMALLPERVASWWRDLTSLPRRVAETHSRTERLLTMADNITTVLTEVADGLRGPLATSITALLAERDTLAARNAELEGAEAAQSTAADDVRRAFASVAGKFAPVEDVEDVPELPAGEPTA